MLTTYYPKHPPHGLQPQPGLPQGLQAQSVQGLQAQSAQGLQAQSAQGLQAQSAQGLQAQSAQGLQAHQAIVQEVFSSIQGEGCWVGYRQLFVRLAHCHLACAYCDTPMTTPSGLAYVETAAGAESWQTYENPMAAEALWEACLPLLQQARHHSLSLTGGEPLLYPEFGAELFALARQAGLKTYLETSGTQPNRLEAILPETDVVAMDIKLASATGQPTPWGLHQQFAQRVRQAPHSVLNLKVVVAPNTPLQELEQLMAQVPYAEVPVFIQPVSPLRLEAGSKEAHPSLVPLVGATQLLRFQEQLSRFYTAVRVIPQTHKWLNVT